MRHLILWTQAVGAGAGGHREGRGPGPLHVHREDVQQYIWHIKTLLS